MRQQLPTAWLFSGGANVPLFIAIVLALAVLLILLMRDELERKPRGRK